VTVVVLAALGAFTLWGAVLVDALTAIIVILNGMRTPDGGDGGGCAASNKAKKRCCSSGRCSHDDGEGRWALRLISMRRT